MRQEQITKQLHEVEEIDTHGLDNKGQPDNLTGVYRWVDKYYEAQIYNYGKRMMFEFIIPEPAAFYGYAQTHQPKVAIIPPRPLPAGLTHRDITELTYQTFIRDYQVQGCQPPPPYSKVVSATMIPTRRSTTARRCPNRRRTSSFRKAICAICSR